jgi:copper chaperone CopZ
MQSTEFVVRHLDAAGVVDLSNALTTVNGVAHVQADLSSGRVTVEYDPAYSNPEIIEGNVKGAGYPIEGSTTTP